MKEVSFLQEKELTFDSMNPEDYEKATGVVQPMVQDQTLLNVSRVAPSEVEDKLSWAAQQVAAITPGDAIESMLVQQMIALNSMIMKSSRLALVDGQTVAEWDMYVKNAVRLSNAFTNVVAALDKHRGKGKQTIVVKHQQVNVSNGGQAVIGDVEHRGGLNGKTE